MTFPDALTMAAAKVPIPTRTEEFVVHLKNGDSICETVTWRPDIDAEPLDQFLMVLDNDKYLRIGSAVYACETVLSISKVRQDPDARTEPD